MPETGLGRLKIVDGCDLPDAYRQVLRPGEMLFDERGRGRRLPRYFYEVDTLLTARETQLAPNFGIYEFIHTDLRESPVLRGFPKYLPCAIAILATYLSRLRDHVQTYIHIAANGGYRSPGHQLSRNASTHHWGTAVNIYRIGDDYLDTPEQIDNYAEVAREVLAGIWTRPYGHGAGFADDHLHIDLGYVTVFPRDADGETTDLPETSPA